MAKNARDTEDIAHLRNGGIRRLKIPIGSTPKARLASGKDYLNVCSVTQVLQSPLPEPPTWCICGSDGHEEPVAPLARPEPRRRAGPRDPPDSFADPLLDRAVPSRLDVGGSFPAHASHSLDSKSKPTVTEGCGKNTTRRMRDMFARLVSPG